MSNNGAVDIVIFTSQLGGGGAERAVVNLTKGFVERGLRVDLVLLRREGVFLKHVPPQVRLISLDASISPYYHRYRWRRWLNFLGHRHLVAFDLDCFLKLNAVIAKAFSLFRMKPSIYSEKINMLVLCLANYLRENRPKAMLAVLTDPNIIALKAKRLAHLPFHLAINEQSMPSAYFRFDHFKEKGIKNLYPKADSIIAISQYVAEDLIHNYGLPSEKITVIYNPVITSDLFEKALQPANHPWLKQKQLPVIAAVGRLVKEKDYPTLFRAIALIRQVRPVRLLVLGEGKERTNLERLAAELGIQNDVSMPGFVDNPFAFMAKASVFVLSSAWEGFGNVIVEALACGCPVVSTDCGGPREILDNGRYGRLVPSGDPEALAKAILETLNDPDKPANREERIRRAMEFSVDKIVSQYLKVLRLR